jgi:hypothetical protein
MKMTTDGRGLPHSLGKMRAWNVMQLICVLSLAVWGSSPTIASTAYGDLNNFDVFNDTGQDCHGFEIELDDIHSTDITYTFDWNHYGTPVIREDNSDPAHPKVFVRYAAKYDPATNGFSAFTAVPATTPSPTTGHMCTDPSVNFGCEHFGVGYYGTPTVVRYNWLIPDPVAPDTLIHGPAVNVATPSWVYYPPAPAQPVAQAQAVILAPPAPPVPVYEFGDASWVKAIITTSHNNTVMELRDLVSDDPADPNDNNWTNGEPDEVEVEWQILQTEFNNPAGANNDLAGANEGLPNGDEVITRRYEFYKYAGPFDLESNEALCSTYPPISDSADPAYKPECDPATVTILGDYIGAQMAGFNVVAVLGLVDHVQDGDITEPYTARTIVVGGNTPYATEVTSGALPAGLNIDAATGVLSGAPSVAGEYSFTVTASDADAAHVSKAYTMTIADPGIVEPPQFHLSVSKSGTGFGTVAGNGIDCGGVCTALLDAGTSVSLTATPDAGSVFSGWSGDCSGMGTCDTIMDAARNVTATFDPCAQATFFRDADGDGFGDPGVATTACAMPAGYVTDNTDCNDASAAIRPGATEICNLIDDNCSGNIDEDGIPTITIHAPDPLALEPGVNAGSLRITRSGCFTVPLVVNFSVVGTATPGIDYVALTGVAEIGPGRKAIQVRITPIDDSLVEPIESVIVALAVSPNYSIGIPTKAKVVIVSNDRRPGH